MAAWVEATTRELSKSMPLINQSKPSVSVSPLSGDTGKPALGPKPHLMPKPFALQRNATVRPIKAPKIEVGKLSRATSSDALDFEKSYSGETHVDGSIKPNANGTAPKPSPLTPKPALTPKPKSVPEPNKQTSPNTRLDVSAVSAEDVKNVQPRSRAKSLGSQDQKPLRLKQEGETRAGDADAKVSSPSWRARNRLSVGLTSMFESSSKPEREVSSVRRDAETSRTDKPSLSPIESRFSKPQVETGEVEDEEISGSSIKRRISLLFDRSSASHHRDAFNKKDTASPEISVDIKQRIKNLSLTTHEPRVRLSSAGALKCQPYEKTSSDSDEPSFSEEPLEKPAQSTPVQNGPPKNSSPPIAAPEKNVLLENKKTSLRSTSEPDANVEEEDEVEEDKENHVAVPLYRRVGITKDLERKRQEEEEREEQLEKERKEQEREKHLEKERKRAEEERCSKEERKQKEEKQRQIEEQKREEEERTKRIEEERKLEEERKREAEKERQREQERLDREKQIEEQKKRIEEKREQERQREEQRLRQEREKEEKLKKEREMEEKRQIEEERLRQQRNKEERLKKERELEEQRVIEEEKRMRQEREKEERLRKEREMEEKRRIEEEKRLRQEREKEERLRKEREMEEKRRIEEEKRLRQEREKEERLRKEREMEEKRRIEEEKRLRQEREKEERLRKEREMEEKRRIEEEKRLRQEREKEERLRKEREMEEKRQNEEEKRLRQEREKEVRLRKEREMEENRQIEEEKRLRQEREKEERLRKEREMKEKRLIEEQQMRQEREEKLKKEREMEEKRRIEEQQMRQERERDERLKKEREMEEKRLIEEEKRLRREREERLRKERELEEKRRIEEQRMRQERERDERLKKEREMEEKRLIEEEKRLRREREERLRKERELEEKRRIEEQRMRQEREREERLKKEREMEEKRLIEEENRLRQEREERLRKERELEEKRRIDEQRMRQERENEERLKKERELEKKRRIEEEERRRQERENERLQMEKYEVERMREEVPTSYDLISFDTEEPKSSRGVESIARTTSVSRQIDEVIYDDFSVKPQRWGTRERRSSTPSPSRESPTVNETPDWLQYNSNDPGSQGLSGDQNLEISKQQQIVEESEPEDLLGSEHDEVASHETDLKDCDEDEDEEQDTFDGIREIDETNNTDDDPAAENRVNQALQRLTSQVTRPSIDSDTPVISQPEPILFPEPAAPLLDSSLLRSKVDLGKKRSIKRMKPSRSVRQRAALPSLTEDTNLDWRFCDSTDAKAPRSNGQDSESEEESNKDATPTSAPSQPKRVPLFPGMDQSALMAQLKRRSVMMETEATEDQTSPVVSARSPRTPTRSLGPRVLPPVDSKDSGGGASPSWLLELKSKKRLSQPESDV